MASNGNVLFLYRNLADTGTVTASSAATPAARVQDMRPGRYWRGTGPTGDWLQIDLGAVSDLTHAAAIGHNLGITDSIRCRVGNDPDGFDEIAPAVSGDGSATVSLPSFVSCTSPSLSGQGLYVSSAAQSATLLLADVPGWNAAAFTVVAECEFGAAGSANTAVYLSDGTSGNQARIVRNSGGNAASIVASGGVAQANLGALDYVYGAGVLRAALAATANDFTLAAAGTLATPDTAGIMPAGMTQLRLGSTVAGTQFLNGWVRRVCLYSRRLSDAELQAVTSGTEITDGLILNLDFTRINPTPVAATDGTYDVLVTGELADGTTAKRWASLTVSGGTGTIQPLVTETRIASYAAFPAGSLTSDQQTRYAATGNTQNVLYDSTNEAWPPVSGFGSDSFGVSLGGYPIVSQYTDYRAYNIFDLGGTVQAQYVRFDFVGSNVQVGRIFAGLGYQPSHNFKYGWDYEWVDPSEVVDTESSVFVVRRSKYRVLRLSLEHLPTAEALSSLDDLKRIVGKSRDLLVVMFPDESLPIQYRTSVYGIPIEQGPIGNPYFQRFATSMTVRELTA